MRFPVFRENLVDDGVGLEACGLKARFDHPQSPEGKNRALERLVGLKPYDNFVVAIDVAGLVGKQCRGSVSVDCKHPFFRSSAKYGCKFRPDGPGALRWSSEKSFVTCVRRGISDNETANVDGTEPKFGYHDALLYLALGDGLSSNSDNVCWAIINSSSVGMT